MNFPADMLSLIEATRQAGLLSDDTEIRCDAPCHVRFKDSKEIVWQGTYNEYTEQFCGGLDEDNQKTFELIVE